MTLTLATSRVFCGRLFCMQVGGLCGLSAILQHILKLLGFCFRPPPSHLGWGGGGGCLEASSRQAIKSFKIILFLGERFPETYPQIFSLERSPPMVSWSSPRRLYFRSSFLPARVEGCTLQPSSWHHFSPYCKGSWVLSLSHSNPLNF